MLWHSCTNAVDTFTHTALAELVENPVVAEGLADQLRTAMPGCSGVR